MRYMRPLVFPIDDLGSGNGEGLKTEILNMVGEKKSPPVQEEIELPVVVKIERGRLGLDILENGVRKPLPQSYGPVESRFERLGEKKFFSDPGDIRRAEKRKSEVPAIFLDQAVIFLLFGHCSPF